MYRILLTSKVLDATYHCVSHHACGCRGRESHDGRRLGGSHQELEMLAVQNALLRKLTECYSARHLQHQKFHS